MITAGVVEHHVVSSALLCGGVQPALALQVVVEAAAAGVGAALRGTGLGRRRRRALHTEQLVLVPQPCVAGDCGGKTGWSACFLLFYAIATVISWWQYEV